MHLNIVIVGRPNVGKSTLFNKLVRKNSSIVFDTPGITRDRIEEKTTISGVPVVLTDTAGFDNTKHDEISIGMIAQSVKAIQSADVILFMVDVRSGITQLDTSFVENLRKYNTKTILLCNKSEGKIDPDVQNEIYAFGFQDMIFMSAEHKIGFNDLEIAIKKFYKKKFHHEISERKGMEEDAKEYIEKTDRLSIAIVGRPNAGKSTIFNKILQTERSIVSKIAGTTRDSIHQSIKYKEKEVDLVDTAGIRKRLNIDDKIEEMSIHSAFTAVNFATVVVLCMDATSPLEAQDLKIARYAIDEGRGLVIVLNKWDLLTEKERNNLVNDLPSRLDNLFPRVKNMPFFTISGKFDDELDEILDECVNVNDIWSKRINTFKLNSFIRNICENNPPPRHKGHKVKVKYATQIKIRPMTILIFTNIIEGITESYTNFIENEIRYKFGIFGVPIRINIKKSDNPYADK